MSLPKLQPSYLHFCLSMYISIYRYLITTHSLLFPSPLSPHLSNTHVCKYFCWNYKIKFTLLCFFTFSCSPYSPPFSSVYFSLTLSYSPCLFMYLSIFLTQHLTKKKHKNILTFVFSEENKIKQHYHSISFSFQHLAAIFKSKLNNSTAPNKHIK